MAPTRISLRGPQISLTYLISNLLVFTCLFLSITYALGVTRGSPGPQALPVRIRTTVVPNGIMSAKNTGSFGHITNNFAPIIQAAMAAVPKVATSPLVASRQLVQPVIQSGDGAATPVSGVGGRLRGQSNHEEPFVQLDYSTISDEILNQRTANFVYFNANFSHCRHCQRFFSTWKELALDVRWWRNVIRMFTINCSDEDNIEVCRRAGVTQFPQLKFYWVMSNSLNQDGQRLRILGKSVHAMRHLIMDKVLDSYLEHNELLAQRDRQHTSAQSAVSNPMSTLTNLFMPNGSPPLSALIPLISQFFGSANASSGNPALAPGSSTSTVGGGAGPAGIMSMLTGKSGSSAASNSVSLTNILNGLGGMQGISQLINGLMSVVSWRKSLTLQRLPSNWPELDAIETQDTQTLLKILPIGPGKATGALLIMETQEFLYTGLEVMLDLNPYTQNQTYYIVRVRDERSQLSRNLTRLDDVQAPALIYVNKLREPKLIVTAPKYTNDEDLRRTFVKAFEKRYIKYPIRRVWSASGGSSAIAAAAMSRLNSTEVDEEIILRMNDIYMNDLLNTIRLSLTDQVLRHPDLSDDQFNALVKYVYALINYFPFNDDEQLKFFKRLHAWLQNQVSPLDISEYKKQFHDVDEILGKRREWVACKTLSTVNTIPWRKTNSFIFENPAQIGKVVSNITRLFKSNHQKLSQLKSLVGMFASSLNSPVVLTNNNQQKANTRQLAIAATQAPQPSTKLVSVSPSPASTKKKDDQKEESSLEKLIKSVTSGSLGSESSILKLISAALGGGNDSKPGKSKFAREYSCGSWKLAHVMVVNEYIRDSPRKDVKHIVLHSLYQYMLHFYACATCGNRVSDVSGEFRLNLNDHLLEQGDSIMLLWKMHNRVNKRLESEIRPGSPNKQQFPSEALCPKCRDAKRQTDQVGLSTHYWHEKQVLNFLVHHYRPQNIITKVDPSSSSSASSSSSSSTMSVPSLNTLLILNTLFLLEYQTWSRVAYGLITKLTDGPAAALWLASVHDTCFTIMTSCQRRISSM